MWERHLAAMFEYFEANYNTVRVQKMVIYKQFFGENRETGVIPVRTRRCVRGPNPQFCYQLLVIRYLEVAG
jgi:hypothetical protein